MEKDTEKKANPETKVVGAMEKDDGKPATQNKKDKDGSYDEMVEPGFWETKGVRWILSLLFMACVGFNLFFFFSEGETESWHQWIIACQAIFLGVIYLLTCIIPLPLLILDVYRFTNYRFG
jgi:hypothetical protein